MLEYICKGSDDDFSVEDLQEEDDNLDKEQVAMEVEEPCTSARLQPLALPLEIDGRGTSERLDARTHTEHWAFSSSRCLAH